MSKPLDYELTKKKNNNVAIWKDLPGTFFRDETIELLHRLVLNISIFS